MAHVPKYQHVFENLSRDILSGKYQPGQKLPSEAALVKQFRTSRITVGRALRELRQRGLIERIAGSGTYARRTQHAPEGMLFGLLIPDLGQTEIFEPICHGIAAAPAAAAHALLWGHVASDRSLEEQALELCGQYIERRVSGVFFAPLETGPNAREVNLKIAARLENAAIPIILLDRCVMPYPRRSRHDLVGIDNRRAGYLATEHLIEAGATRLAFVAQTGGAPTVEARIAGFREALGAHGLGRGVVYRGPDVPALDPLPDGIVAVNDRTAAHVMRALLAAGRRIPQDVRITGIDDVHYADVLPVPLTTIRQPCREIGEAAMSAMLDRIAHPNMLVRDILLDCNLVVRESSGAK